MLVVMLINMSLIPLQITTTSSFEGPTFTHMSRGTVRISGLNDACVYWFVSTTETLDKICLSLIVNDILKPLGHKEINFLCVFGCIML